MANDPHKRCGDSAARLFDGQRHRHPHRLSEPLPTTPVDALRSGIQLLDRGHSPRPKVQAFLRAIEIVERVGPAEIDSRVATGTLTELDGIGKSTGEVIADAVNGTTDGYLARLDERTRIPVGEGAKILEAIRGDCHSHTRWSDGGATSSEMALAAIALGHEWLVITDHSARLTIAHGLDEARLAQQLDEIAELNESLAPFRILTGMEVDIFEDGSLDLSDQMLAQLDLVVASAHSKLKLPAVEMTKRLIEAVASPHVDVLGHCTNRKITGRGRPPSLFDAPIVFAACSQFGTAVEINCGADRHDPPDELVTMAIKAGCKISINSDAHATGQLEWQATGADKAARCGVAIDDIINTWTAEQLLSWASDHSG